MFTRVEYQRAFDVHSLGKIVSVAELPAITFEIDTDEDFVYIGFFSKKEKSKKNIFHRKIEFQRAIVETTKGLFFVSIGSPRESLVVWYGNYGHKRDLAKLLERFSHVNNLSSVISYEELMISHKSDHYFFIYQL